MDYGERGQRMADAGRVRCMADDAGGVCMWQVGAGRQAHLCLLMSLEA